jgi:A/G-specific adenine glycosylase
MLQQTQAPRVEPLFEAFLARFPDVETLAAASGSEVLRAWAGLGYNRRAVALHETATAIAREHGGRVPRDPEALRALPGIGPYTANAVASIAYGAVVPAPDTNARRIVARVARAVEPDELPPSELAALAAEWVDAGRPGDWNQALMDLGREVCRPSPRCDACPLAAWCGFRASGRTGRASARRQSSFHGSRRQVRGRIVDVLRQGTVPARSLPARCGFDDERVRDAVDSLVRDGVVVVRRGRAALVGDIVNA